MSGKHERSPFLSSVFRAQKPLELVHMDLCGPIKPSIQGGKSYFLLIVDDFTRYMWISLLTCKAEALNRFNKFKVMAEEETETKLKYERSDRGGEFLSKEFKAYSTTKCEENGILRQLTTPHNP